MSHAVVINALLEQAQWSAVSENMKYVEHLFHTAEELAPRKDIHIVADKEKLADLGSLTGGLKKIPVENRNAAQALRKVHSTIRGYEDCIYFFIDTPLIDAGIARAMLELHGEEMAEYTYGEGFPLGVTPEVMRVDLIPKIVSLLKSDENELERDTLFSALQKEINSFDVETYFAPRDMKLRRIELTLSPKRNRLVTERVIQREGARCTYEQFCRLVDREPGILRSLPSFVEIEITNRVNGPCTYLPHRALKRDMGDMDFETYKQVLDSLHSFAEEFHVSLSYLGEPMLHGKIRQFIEYTLDKPGVQIILESDGYLFTPEFADYVNGLNCDNLHIIFDVDAVQEKTYKNIREGDLRRVERNVRYLLSKGMDNVYAQMVRMDLNEGEMLQFYDQWEKDGAGVIIQKYNSYLGALPERSRADLRPLDRQPCWHLMRDLIVLHNGDVPRCRQDINVRFPLGNLANDPVEDVWMGNEKYYLDHCSGSYDEDCSICDEYYTFNF